MRKKRVLIACAPPNYPRARTECREAADVPTVRSGGRSTPATTAIQRDEDSAAETLLGEVALDGDPSDGRTRKRWRPEERKATSGRPPCARDARRRRQHRAPGLPGVAGAIEAVEPAVRSAACGHIHSKREPDLGVDEVQRKARPLAVNAELRRPGPTAVMRDYDRRGIRRSTRLVLRRMDGCEPGLRVNEMHPVDEGRKIANGRPRAAIAGGHDAYRGIEGRARQARVHRWAATSELHCPGMTVIEHGERSKARAEFARLIDAELLLPGASAIARVEDHRSASGRCGRRHGAPAGRRDHHAGPQPAVLSVDESELIAGGHICSGRCQRPPGATPVLRLNDERLFIRGAAARP